MQKITLLIEQLSSLGASSTGHNPFSLVAGEDFSWNHHKRVITYSPDDPHASEYILHEVSHALLGHRSYTYDIDLITMERDAWQKARSISKQYGVKIDNDTIETALDSYRDWMHARSSCPPCGATGVQQTNKTYKCLNCNKEWVTNEARTCALRRYGSKKHP